MATRMISFYGLFVLGVFSFSTPAAADEAVSCTGALHRALETVPDGLQATARTALPESCRAIGPIKLGMSTTEVLAALGQPNKRTAVKDHPENVDVVYVYPRDLNAQLARNPVSADKIHYSELGIRFHEGQVQNIAVFSNIKAPPPFKLLGRAVGSDVGGILKDIGGSPEWNASRDYVQYPGMPIGISVDPATYGIVGVDIADQKQDLDTFNVQGLILIKDERAGLFRGFQ